MALQPFYDCVLTFCILAQHQNKSKIPTTLFNGCLDVCVFFYRALFFIASIENESDLTGKM